MPLINKNCFYTVTNSETGGVFQDNCHTFKVGLLQPEGTCMFPQQGTEHLTSTAIDCKCYYDLLFLSGRFGTPQYITAYCPEEVETVFSGRNFIRCACPFSSNSLATFSNRQVSKVSTGKKLTVSIPIYGTAVHDLFIDDLVSSPYISIKTGAPDLRIGRGLDAMSFKSRLYAVDSSAVVRAYSDKLQLLTVTFILLKENEAVTNVRVN